jgi:hypothetical protein
MTAATRRALASIGLAAIGLAACAAPRAAAAQTRQFTVDVRPVDVALGYAWRVAPARLFGFEVGLGAPQLEKTLTPRGPGFHDLEELFHLGAFVRFVPDERVAVDVGLRASLADVAVCDASDCLPGIYGAGYVSAFYGRRRLKVGALVQAGRIGEPGSPATTVVNVSPLIARLTF